MMGYYGMGYREEGGRREVKKINKRERQRSHSMLTSLRERKRGRKIQRVCINMKGSPIQGIGSRELYRWGLRGSQEIKV